MDKMDKRNQPSRNMPGKAGQQAKSGHSGQTMQQGQSAPPPKGAQPTHTGNK